MSNSLSQLKELTSDLNILLVEDSKPLQKQISKFLSKLFKKVYQAYDGIDGLESYKNNKPDIVLTDITMPNMSGHDMIKNLKQINPNIQIIIISAHADTQNLLESIHLGVTDFVPKPIDIKQLQEAISKAAKVIKKSNVFIDVESVKTQKDIIKKFDIIKENHSAIQLINYYRGVPIIHEGNIVATGDDTITVQTQKIQTLAIGYEKQTVIESEFIKNDILAELVNIDPVNRQIKLQNMQSLEFSPGNRTQVRVEPDEEFKVIIHYKGKKFDMLTVKDVSIKSLSFFIKELPEGLDKGDDIDLIIGCKIYHKTAYSEVAHNERIACKAKIFKIIQNNRIEVVVLLELAKGDESIMSKYIYHRELELIDEFKQLNR